MKHDGRPTDNFERKAIIVWSGRLLTSTKLLPLTSIFTQSSSPAPGLCIHLNMQSYCGDRLLIILLGVTVALGGIGNIRAPIKVVQPGKVFYFEIVSFVSILCWRVYVSCRELKKMDEGIESIMNEIQKKSLKKKELEESLHISVKEMLDAGLTKDSKIHKIEDLKKDVLDKMIGRSHDNISFYGKMTQYWNRLFNNRVQDSDASEESHLTNITQSTGDANVNELIRESAIAILRDEVRARRKSVTNGSLSCYDFVSFLIAVRNILRNIGKKKDALEMHKEALSICRSMYGKNNTSITRAMMGMANVMCQLGQKMEAIKTYQEVLSIQESLHGRNHTDTALTMTKMAGVMYEIGQHTESLKMYQQALTVQESIYGRNHAETARTIMNMASVMRQLGQKKEALKFYQQALSIQEFLFGRNHADTASTMYNMAVVVYEMGQKRESLEMFKKALIVHDWVLGPEHAHTADTRECIRIVSDQIGKGASGG